MAPTSSSHLFLPILIVAVASATAVDSRQSQQAKQTIMAPPPPLASIEELWELCERFPSLDACEVLNSGVVPAGPAAAAVEKRKSAYMRFGKRSGIAPMMAEPEPAAAEVEKRKSAYMRFGKRKSAYMRFGKRSGAHRWPEAMAAEVEKRKSAYMRFGK